PPYIGEPNIKESAGGLRDVHTAMWLGATKFGERTLRELAEKGVISAREQRLAEEALTFLWRVRNELHFLAGHKNDVLARDVQPEIAKRFGYGDDETSLGVEKFMRDYYLHARAVHRVSRRLIARGREGLSRRASAARRHRQAALADGLVFFDGRLHLAEADPRTFAEDRTRLMKVFWHLHRLGCELSLDLERAIEDSLDFVDDAFRRSPAVRDLFLDICRNWGRVALTLREMHELGLLGRYLPEFGALTCLVQYDAYHKFSADQHSLLAVENLEALAPQWLSMLYLLTYADMKAVGPGVMTGWHAAILWDLHSLTLARLTGGEVDRPNRAQLTEKVCTAIKDEASRQVVMGHLAMMSDRYLAGTGVQRVAEHLRLVQQLDSTPVVTELFHHPDLGTSDLVVVTRD